MKKFFVLFIVGGVSAALASAYFFFPATAKDVLTWADVFGSSGSGQSGFEVDLANADASTTTSADTATSMDGGDPLATEEAVDSGSGSADPTVSVPLDSALDSAPDGPPSSTAIASDPIIPVQTPPPICTTSTSDGATTDISRKILINEIAWMGSVPLAGETALKASSREWMELKNITPGAITLSGWQLMDPSGKLDVVFGAGATISADGFYLLERTASDASETLPGVLADQTYSGTLSNDGNTLVLLDANCGVSDRIDAASGWPGGDNTTKQTLERDANGLGWHTSVPAGGTPRAENSVAPLPAPAPPVPAAPVASSQTPSSTESTVQSTTQSVATTSTDIAPTSTATSTVTSTAQSCASSTQIAAPAHLVIAEIEIAGVTADQDFLKIFNPTTNSVDISGWRLRKKSKSGADYSLRSLADGSVIAPGGYFVWANAADGFGDAIAANVTSTETLAVDNSVALFDASGTIIDALAWGEGMNQYVESAAYLTNPQAGQVLKRKFVDAVIIDTDNNGNDFAI